MTTSDQLSNKIKKIIKNLKHDIYFVIILNIITIILLLTKNTVLRYILIFLPIIYFLPFTIKCLLLELKKKDNLKKIKYSHFDIWYKEENWNQFEYRNEIRKEKILTNNISRIYFKNGLLESEVHYKNNEINGPAKYYYPSGILKGEGIFKNAQPTGLWKFYYENGQLKNEINYENGKAGIERCYDKEGHLKLKIVKREYLFESNLELCYDKNGNTWINTNYKKEKRFTKFEKLFLHILGTILIILISFIISTTITGLTDENLLFDSPFFLCLFFATLLIIFGITKMRD